MPKGMRGAPRFEVMVAIATSPAGETASMRARAAAA
jgi:hypothetical protein